MELRHLRYFIAVAEELNFTRAAKRLHLAQPSLTRQIRNLEEELNVQLLDRGKKQVSLTPEGQSFLLDAKRLIEQSLESMASVQRLSRGEGDRLNVGYLFKFSYDLMAATLAAFREKSPEISVNLIDLSPAEQFRSLDSQRIDLGFVGLRPPANTRHTASLDWARVTRHEMCVALPAKHSLAGKRRINLADLRQEFFVIMSEKSHPGSKDWLSDQCAQTGFAPRILQDVEFESALMSFVAEGLGVTLARRQMEELLHPGVVFRPLAPKMAGDYWIAWNRENRSKALNRYIEVIKAKAGCQSPGVRKGADTSKLST